MGTMVLRLSALDRFVDKVDPQTALDTLAAIAHAKWSKVESLEARLAQVERIVQGAFSRWHSREHDDVNLIEQEIMEGITSRALADQGASDESQ